MSLKRGRPLVPRPPWFSFILGGILAILLAPPLLVLVAEWLRPRPDDAESLLAVARLTLMLTALPSFLVGGGVARMVSDKVHLGQRLPALLGQAAGELALAGAALATIALSPYGLPESFGGWLVLALVGGVAAAPAGVAIALFTRWRVRRSERDGGKATRA